MGAMKELYTEVQTEMFNVAELLNEAAGDGDFDLMQRTLIECTAKLAVATRRYSEAYL
jgi:hypothetical protein